MDQEWHYGANKGTCMNRLENLFISFINLKIFAFTNSISEQTPLFKQLYNTQLSYAWIKAKFQDTPTSCSHIRASSQLSSAI